VWVVKGSGGGAGENWVSSSVRSRSAGVITATTTIQTSQPQVCSHQLLNPPALKTTNNNIPPADGSLEAMEAFWWSTAGIKCYDIDVVTLQDGTLMASHPNRLSTALSTITGYTRQQDEVHILTLENIQSVLGKEETRRSFPLLDEDLLPYYARLIKGSEPFFYGGVDDGSNAQRSLRGPLLNLDLKQGPYLTKERLLSIVDTILELEIENNVAICVTPLAEEEKQKQQQQQQQQQNNHHYLLDMLSILHEYNMQQKQSNNRIIPLGLVLRDLIEVDQDTARVQNLIRQYDSIKLLVPSYKFSEPWYQQIYSVFPRLPITVWTIDTQSEYQYSKSMNVSAVIANRPMDF
jgi:hypothetical protein